MTSPRFPRAVLFDLDGTLLDSAPDMLATANLLRDRHGLPPMRMAVPDAVGGSAIRRDFVNETFGVIAEVDGRLGHEADGRARDARRDRKTLARGMVTARQTWGEVRFTPCELAADLFGIYRSRGYAGVLTLCSPTCGAARDASAAPSAPVISASRGGLVLP